MTLAFIVSGGISNWVRLIFLALSHKGDHNRMCHKYLVTTEIMCDNGSCNSLYTMTEGDLFCN